MQASVTEWRVRRQTGIIMAVISGQIKALTSGLMKDVIFCLVKAVNSGLMKVVISGLMKAVNAGLMKAVISGLMKAISYLWSLTLTGRSVEKLFGQQ